MIVKNLTKGATIYTSNAYLCSASGSDGLKGGDISHEIRYNLLIDTGCDPCIVTVLKKVETDTGHQPVSEVILTHSHYDHTRMIHAIRTEWKIKTYAYSSYIEGIDRVVRDGEQLLFDGYTFDLIHVPGHTTDSLCIFCREEGYLFSGDTPLVIWGTDGTYELPFVRGFERLTTLNVTTIYPGHGEPITCGCSRILDLSLRNLRKSRLI